MCQSCKIKDFDKISIAFLLENRLKPEVFTSIDGFRRPVLMQREGQDFAAYVMAAPGPLRFAFQVGEQIFCSRTAPQAP